MSCYTKEILIIIYITENFHLPVDLNPDPDEIFDLLFTNVAKI